MEHDLELFSPILEILEIGVCNIIYNPGNIGKHFFSLSPTSILEIVDRTVHISILSWKYWSVRSIISPILEILDRTIHTQSYLGNSGSYDAASSPILEGVDRTIHISVLSWK